MQSELRKRVGAVAQPKYQPTLLRAEQILQILVEWEQFVYRLTSESNAI